MTKEELDDHWEQRAACRGRVNDMFPKSYRDISYLPTARALCRKCEVKSECLEYALSFPIVDMQGVWAGMTPRQLAKEQRRRGIKPTRGTIAAVSTQMTEF